MGSDILHNDAGDNRYPYNGIPHLLHGSGVILRTSLSNLNAIMDTNHVRILAIHDILFDVDADSDLYLSIR